MNDLTEQRTEAAYPPGLIDRLGELMDGCQPSNKNDLVIVLAIACIEEGVHTTPHIIGALRRLGFKPRHVGAVLKGQAGGNPQLHRWQRDKEGRYSLHPDEPQS